MMLGFRLTFALVSVTMIVAPLTAFGQTLDTRVRSKETSTTQPDADAFFAATGPTPAGRELYDAMVRASSDLFESGDEPEMLYARKLAEIRERFRERDAGGPIVPIEVSAGDVATLLFMGSLTDLPKDDPTHVRTSYELFRSEIADAIAKGPLSEPMGQLFNAWLIALPQGNSAWRGLRRAIVVEIDEALPAARHYALDEQASASNRAMALCMIKKFGNRSDVPLIAPLLEDDRLPADECINVPDPMQVRDLALEVSLSLVGEDPFDYGYREKPLGEQFYIPVGFPTDQVRQQALKTWAERDVPVRSDTLDH